MGTTTALAWSVVIPVKLLAVAKSRLTGLADADRQALVLAMAADTVAVAVACQAVSAVVVVSDDPSVRAEVGALGAAVIGDEQASGLNPALEAGARYAAQHWPGRGLAALTADLPALSASDLHSALTAASAVPQAFVPDAAGSGTTLYAASAAADFRPRFGPRSSARHRRAGAFEIALPVHSGLRRDVDTLADFAAAERIGIGRRSAAVSEALPTA